MDRLVLTDWRSGNELPILPTGSDDLFIGHLVLYLNLGSVYEHAPDRSFEPQVDVSSVTMLVGWCEEFAETPIPTRKKLKNHIIDALSHLDLHSKLKHPVIISPYLDAGEHLYCFPKTMRDIEPREDFAGVHFRSECTCGYGDISGGT